MLLLLPAGLEVVLEAALEAALEAVLARVRNRWPWPNEAVPRDRTAAAWEFDTPARLREPGTALPGGRPTPLPVPLPVPPGTPTAAPGVLRLPEEALVPAQGRAVVEEEGTLGAAGLLEAGPRAPPSSVKADSVRAMDRGE
jgi:hypothetical protein